jgi:late competence protein required for DNA uptake (superfamily II DNA/RNA helicase)
VLANGEVDVSWLGNRAKEQGHCRPFFASPHLPDISTSYPASTSRNMTRKSRVMVARTCESKTCETITPLGCGVVYCKKCPIFSFKEKKLIMIIIIVIIKSP